MIAACNSCSATSYILSIKHIENLCCGFGNYDDVHERAVKLHDALMQASQNGKYPIVIDHSACFNHAFKHMPDLEINDISEILVRSTSSRH